MELARAGQIRDDQRGCPHGGSGNRAALQRRLHGSAEPGVRQDERGQRQQQPRHGHVQGGRDRAAEQEAEAEHLLAGAGEPNALPRRWVTLFWSQRSSIAESRWAGMVESSLIIGSDAAQCDLCLPDRKVSPQHCVLAAQGDALLVQPLSDRAKVYVNGERIDGEHRLQNNDTLRIGKTTVRLVL